MKAETCLQTLPEGFGLERRGELICVFAESRREEMLSLARGERADPAAIRFLRGRGRPAVIPSGRDFLVVRHYYHGGIFRRLTGDRFFGIGRFLNELRLLALARRSGVGVPEPAGLLIEPASPFLFRADLVTVYIPRSVDLLSYYRNNLPAGRTGPAEGLPAAIAAAGRQTALLHRAGIFHRDLQLKNILVRPLPAPPAAFILDLDRGRQIPAGKQRWWRANLFRLYRSFLKMRLSLPSASRYDPIRFLRAYAPRDRSFRREVIRRCLRRQRGNYLHRVKWKLSFFLGGGYYARPMEGETGELRK